MSVQQLEAFMQLKKLVEQQFKNTHEECQTEIEDWKGQEIKSLQNSLRETVGGYVSEKWFYTHIKNRENQKLPREDMLNLLAQYVGFDSWKGYLQAQAPATPLSRNSKANYKKWGIVFFSFLIISLLFAYFLKTNQTEVSAIREFEVKFCFIDQDSREPIEGLVEVEQVHQNQSVEYYKTEDACVEFETRLDRIDIVIKAPYYKSKRIRRLVNDGHEEQIPLKKDDYALMLHYFSTQNLEDWEKRRKQLDEILHEEVRCVQVLGADEMGVELMNKQEFMDRMTLPINSLKNIEILNTEYQEGKIWILRFQVKPSKQ